MKKQLIDEAPHATCEPEVSVAPVYVYRCTCVDMISELFKTNTGSIVLLCQKHWRNNCYTHINNCFNVALT